MKPVKKGTYSHEAVHSIKARLRNYKLHTVCEEARCPNLGECFNRGTATFMILGDRCTRSCKFCNVGTLEHWNVGTLELPSASEPESIARMAAELDLKHVVITSVTRDDLPDEGASQFAKTVKAVKQCSETSKIEVLTPDFHAREDCLKTVCETAPDIFNHNIETVRRLTPAIRSHAEYDRSLQVLSWVKRNYPKMVVKSGLMVGLGETREEVVETLSDLCKAGCRIVTIGQYLAPSKEHVPVAEYVSEEAFKEYKVLGERLGINHVFSGQFVRSSYMAKEVLWTVTSR